MAKYLCYGNFAGEGLKGLVKEGGSGRVAAVKELFESVWGNQESWYLAFSKNDDFGIADLANVSGATGGRGSSV